MARFKITIGSYETDDIRSDLEEALAIFLSRTGNISDVPGRGLKVTEIRPAGRPGNISRSVMDVLIEKPGLSKQKIAARLPDFEFKQIESALRRLHKAGEISSRRVQRGKYVIWYYSPTDEGIEKHADTDEAEKNAKKYAKELWALFKVLKFRKNQTIPYELILAQSGLNKSQVRFGLKALQELNVIRYEKTSGEWVIGRAEG